MRAILIAAAALCFATPTSAHDFWLQPAQFRPAAGAPVETTMYVGHGPDRQIWNVPAARVVALRTIGAAGTVDARAALLSQTVAGRARFAFPTPGTFVVSLESTNAVSVLPGPRFQAYAEEAGLAAILRDRARTRTEAREGREIYSRRAKAIVQVAQGGADAHVTRPLGLTLEIVPDRNPYALRPGEELPVRVYYRGAPLRSARVTMTDLRADDRPTSVRRTDERGRARFPMRPGAWMLNVVWSSRIEGDPRADFETIFSSLTFGP